MDLPLFIAGRYLFAKKSHNVINVISAISVIGMAIGTAALILILSVYNGFDGIIRENISDLDPDVLIRPSEGRFFKDDGTMAEPFREDPRVESAGFILEDNVFIRYAGNQGLARAKGLDEELERCSAIGRHITDGHDGLHFGSLDRALVGSGIAREMSIRPRFTDAIEMYYPDRGGKVSLISPAASLNSVSLRPGGVFSISADTDDNLIIVPIGTMRRLVRDSTLVSGLELRLRDSSDKAVRSFISTLSLPQGFRALDRYRQNPSLYRMMRYEKLAIYLILIFVVIIVAFNIFGSLSMLIIEKKEDIVTLRALGITGSQIRRVFLAEGWLISLLGMVAGLAVGVVLALVQQHFGIIKMPGNYLITAYPVILKFSDVLLTALGVAAVGFAVAAFPAISGTKG